MYTTWMVKWYRVCAISIASQHRSGEAEAVEGSKDHWRRRHDTTYHESKGDREVDEKGEEQRKGNRGRQEESTGHGRSGCNRSSNERRAPPPPTPPLTPTPTPPRSRSHPFSSFRCACRTRGSPPPPSRSRPHTRLAMLSCTAFPFPRAVDCDCD